VVNIQGPWDPAEHAMAQDRRPGRQTPIPRAGDRVLFRMEPFGPLTDAEVLDVQDLEDRSDHYLWRVVTDEYRRPVVDGAGERVMQRAPDPWPIVTLRTDWGRLTTREGRVRGSQGWWPLDWERRWYPKPGGGGWYRPCDEGMPT